MYVVLYEPHFESNYVVVLSTNQCFFQANFSRTLKLDKLCLLVDNSHLLHKVFCEQINVYYCQQMNEDYSLYWSHYKMPEDTYILLNIS